MHETTEDNIKFMVANWNAKLKWTEAVIKTRWGSVEQETESIE